MITWSERCEMYLGTPSVVLIAEAYCVRLSGRYYPKLADAAAKRSAFMYFASGIYNTEWDGPLALSDGWGDMWLRSTSRRCSTINPSFRGCFTLEDR